MLWGLLVALLVILVVAVVIILFVWRGSNKQGYKDEVFFWGGANADTGQISTDNNYFKGVSDELSRTTVVSENLRSDSYKSFVFVINNLNTNQQTKVRITDELIIGRVDGEKVFCIKNDNAVSKQHCKFYLYLEKLYVSDLNSSNHTFVNNKRITEPVLCKNGDVVKIGNTFLKIEM